MDLRVGGHIHVQEVAEVFELDEVVFPLKSIYDRAHGTLEGLSAPYGRMSDVAPQGLRDMGVFDETGPVGVEAGALPEAPDDPAVEDQPEGEAILDSPGVGTGSPKNDLAAEATDSPGSETHLEILCCLCFFFM